MARPAQRLSVSSRVLVPAGPERVLRHDVGAIDGRNTALVGGLERLVAAACRVPRLTGCSCASRERPTSRDRFTSTRERNGWSSRAGAEQPDDELRVRFFAVDMR